MKENYGMKKMFYSVSEFHDLLGGIISRGYLYEMVRSGEIKTTRIGGEIVIPAAWVEKYLTEKTGVPFQQGANHGKAC
jgi:excisionase family DNA binding protein